MNELKEAFPGIDKGKSKGVDGKPSHSAMSSYLYFAIPFIVLTSINVFFFYNVGAALSFGLNAPFILILMLLITVDLASKIVIAGKLSRKEKTLISGALHSLFMGMCLISLLIPYNAIYVKALLVLICFFKSKEMIGNLHTIWKSTNSKK